MKSLHLKEQEVGILILEYRNDQGVPDQRVFLLDSEIYREEKSSSSSRRPRVQPLILGTKTVTKT